MDEWQDAAREVGEEEIERLLAKAKPEQTREAILEFLPPQDFSKFIVHLSGIVEPQRRRRTQIWDVAEQIGEHIVRFVGVEIDTETEAIRVAKEDAQRAGRTILVTTSMRVESPDGDLLYHEKIPNASSHLVYPDGRVQKMVTE